MPCASTPPPGVFPHANRQNKKPLTGRRSTRWALPQFSGVADDPSLDLDAPLQGVVRPSPLQVACQLRAVL